MPVYAHCPSCGLDFKSRVASVEGNVTGVTMMGNAETCPRCGRLAVMMSGIFDFDGAGNPEVVEGPGWTRDLVLGMTPAQARRLGTGVEWARRELHSNPSNEDEVRRKVTKLAEKEAPWVAHFIEAALSSKAANFVAILGFIVVMLTFFGWAPADQNREQPAQIVITDEQLNQLFDEYLKQSGDGDGSRQQDPTPPAPTQQEPPTTLA